MENMTEWLSVDFGIRGNSGEFCRTGWGRPEPDHTWTIGPDSTLELPRPAVSGEYRLILRLGPFVWRETLPHQRLAVYVNGTQLGAFEVQEPTAIGCTVPWSVVEPHETILVKLVHPDAARPSEVNGVRDHREIAFALERLQFLPQSDHGQSDDSAIGSHRAALSENRLMMQFESLGENCEFGLVQRRCGSEPLGLLRFASAPLPKLLNGLKHRFAGMGGIDQLDVQAAASEYLVIDRRFGFLYHPWVLIGEAAPDDIKRREAMRLPFLRRKMLEDLREGRKIFVYHGMRELSDAEAIELQSAIRAYGPGVLLWVELSDDAPPPGSVETIRPGLLKGHIDRFAPGEDAHDFSLNCWLDICRNAYALAGSRSI